MNKILLVVFISSSFLFGSSIETTDFIPRVVNFTIFAGIIYYLIADKLKEFLGSRQEEIRSKLSEAQEKLANSKKQKLQAFTKIQESEKMALEIIKVAKDECKNIKKQYKEQTNQSLASMKRTYEDRMLLDARRVKIEVTKEILDEFVDDSFSSISQEQIINIINSKVA